MEDEQSSTGVTWRGASAPQYFLSLGIAFLVTDLNNGK
jgi:hypothetical protein